MKNVIIGFVMGLAVIAAQVATARAEPLADNAYLDGLVGDWTMTGTLLGKPVHYTMRGTRVLAGGFVLLDMVDVHAPPQYAARVYVGYDARANDYVAHWLDVFGAAGARVVGTGHRSGARLELLFPYADGAFRDTFVPNPAGRSWSLLIEEQKKDGMWSTFAQYAIVRR